MNICFLLGGFTGVGGIGRVTSILANELSKDRYYKINTLSFFDNNKQNLYNLSDNIKHDFLFDKPINMTKGFVAGGKGRLKKYLQENDIDILIACGALYFPLAILSSKGLKTKTICWEHSNVQNSKDHSFQLFSRKIGAKNADLVVTLTKKDKQSYIGKYKISNVEHIYNPIDENIFEHVQNYNNNSKKIISIGRLSYQKNFENLIEVAKQVFEVNPSWTWDIYGEGDLKNELELKIRENNLTNHVFLKGRVDDLYERYKNYSFLVMTSRYEGFPMTLLEGMAHGLPLVSYDILTGPNEIITDDINGYLIKPFETNLIANRINSLISNPNLRKKMSEKNIEFCDQYTLDKIVDKWKLTFNNLE